MAEIERWITTDEGNHLPIIDGKISPRKQEEDAFLAGLGWDDKDVNDWQEAAEKTAAAQVAVPFRTSSPDYDDKLYAYTSQWKKFEALDAGLNKKTMGKYGKGFSFNENKVVAIKKSDKGVTTVQGVFNNGGMALVKNEAKKVYKLFRANEIGKDFYKKAYEFANKV